MVHTQRLVDDFLALCRINSPPKQEAEVIDAVLPRLHRLGLEVRRDNAGEKIGGNADNVIARLPANVPGVPPIFFSAHFDTVEPNPNVQVIVEDDLIRTDGTSILGADDKAGLAPLLEAIECIVENNLPHGEIWLLLSVAEEIGLLGAKHLPLERINATMGFVLDTGPPVGRVVVGAPTHDHLTVRVIGRAAHAGAAPEQGISAIVAASRAIARMKLGRIDEETTANIGTFHGGQATNVVCPEVEIRAEARSHNLQKLEAQIQHMIACFREEAEAMGAQAEIETSRHYEAYRLSEDAPVVRIARESALALGLPYEAKLAGGGSDANVYNAKGIPTVVLSTGMDKVHTHNECCRISDLEKTARWVLEIVRRVAEG
ncbi:MAG: M20/M25/M40 family metallo-hydrolase [Chthonomonadetes bacterium]|nr:M20/M25/M40 family metallo-hydrolase [Chthonomonadetes bacterium]